MARSSIFAAAIIVCAPAALAQATPCNLASAGSAQVARVIDGRTFVLADGREVRVAGLELPPRDTATARDALAALIAGRTVTLKATVKGEDRYGRVVALGTTDDGTAVAAEMLRQGQARFSGRLGAPSAQASACTSALFAAEREAREHRRGLWANAAYAPRQADNPQEILNEIGHFALVEGRILSVRESGAMIYVNFGRRWSRDFTVTILRRNRRIFSAAGIDPKSLEGRRIRVRGVIEQRGGPQIEASRPEQIELMD
jgi:endonuclease YncB( thermonuclease family)